MGRTRGGRTHGRRKERKESREGGKDMREIKLRNQLSYKAVWDGIQNTGEEIVLERRLEEGNLLL